MVGKLVFTVTVWVVLAGAYLLFAGQVSMTELIAGGLATTAATAFAVLLHQAQPTRLRLGAPWPRVIGGPLAALLPDAVRVGGVLLHALWRRPDGPLGVVTTQPFRRGHNQPQDAGRRGLVTLGLSVAPNGYVLGVSENEDVLPMHRLVPVAPSPNRDWPT